MLLMEHPRRLSTDIDIIVEPGTDLDDYLDKASAIFPFRSVDEQKQIGKNNIEKRHFKFTYDSPINNKPFYILLDVLFEENHYAELVSKNIDNELLLTEPEYLSVQIPSPDCILADKLTAFAPHTTGIRLNDGKDMEVMKQLYDVCSLIEIFADCEKVMETYIPIAEAELAYRGLDRTPTDCLWDTFHASLCIASRGKAGADEYPIYVKGIRDLRGHIYSENYSPEIAAGRCADVMYLVMCLLTGKQFTPVEDEHNRYNTETNRRYADMIDYYGIGLPDRSPQLTDGKSRPYTIQFLDVRYTFDRKPHRPERREHSILPPLFGIPPPNPGACFRSTVTE